MNSSPMQLKLATASRLLPFCDILPFVGTVMISYVHRLAVAGWKGDQHMTLSETQHRFHVSYVG